MKYRAAGGERGAILIEFALCIPVLVFMLTVMVDVWVLVRHADVLLTASQHAARTAGAQARRIALNGDLPNACGDPSGASSVLNGAVRLAFRYLHNTGLETGVCVPAGQPRTCTGNPFTVTASFTMFQEGSFKQRAVQVEVKRSTAPCLFCLLPMGSLSTLRAASTYPVEVDCAAAGPIT